MTDKPRRTQRERVGESSRRLAEAAIALIAEQGYAATTAQEIGLRAGYSRDMVRVRFGTRKRCSRRSSPPSAKADSTSRMTPVNPGSTASGRIARMRRFAEEDGQLLRAILVLNFEAAQADDQLRTRIRRQTSRRRIPTDREYADLLAFRTAMRRFMQWSEERAQAEGMTHLQHQLLLAVRAHDDHRGPTVGEAAEYLLMTPSSASELVDRAEAGGFVRRQRSGEDARVVRLHLDTDVGQQKLGALTIDVFNELARVGPVLQLVLADAARGLCLPTNNPILGWPPPCARAGTNRMPKVWGPEGSRVGTPADDTIRSGWRSRTPQAG